MMSDLFMEEEEEEDERGSLSERLEELLEAGTGRSMRVGEMIDALGSGGFGILLMIFAMPSAMPLPAAGYSTPFGIVVSLLALQMIFGKRVPWVPEKTREIKVRRGFAVKMIKSSIWFLKKIERFICPRMGFICGVKGSVVMGLLILLMGGLMILPIPLTNTFPAVTVFVMAVGLIEGDGLFCLGAIFLSVVAVAIYSYVVYVLIVYGIAGVIVLKDLLWEKILGYF